MPEMPTAALTSETKHSVTAVMVGGCVCDPVSTTTTVEVSPGSTWTEQSKVQASKQLRNTNEYQAKSEGQPNLVNSSENSACVAPVVPRHEASAVDSMAAQEDPHQCSSPKVTTADPRAVKPCVKEEDMARNFEISHTTTTTSSTGTGKSTTSVSAVDSISVESTGSSNGSARMSSASAVMSDESYPQDGRRCSTLAENHRKHYVDNFLKAANDVVQTVFISRVTAAQDREGMLWFRAATTKSMSVVSPILERVKPRVDVFFQTLDDKVDEACAFSGRYYLQGTTMAGRYYELITRYPARSQYEEAQQYLLEVCSSGFSKSRSYLEEHVLSVSAEEAGIIRSWVPSNAGSTRKTVIVPFVVIAKRLQLLGGVQMEFIKNSYLSSKQLIRARLLNGFESIQEILLTQSERLDALRHQVRDFLVEGSQKYNIGTLATQSQLMLDHTLQSCRESGALLHKALTEDLVVVVSSLSDHFKELMAQFRDIGILGLIPAVGDLFKASVIPENVLPQVRDAFDTLALSFQRTLGKRGGWLTTMSFDLSFAAEISVIGWLLNRVPANA